MTGRSFSPWLAVALGVFVVLALVAYSPCSFAPHRLALGHRTASSHAVEMLRFGEYFRTASPQPFSFLRIWAYPEGGVAKPLALPSLAAGAVLCQWVSARDAFNLLFLLNLVLSAMSFYLLARRLDIRAPSAIAFAALVVFHPCLQSFILRGQIENVMLWPVGFSLLAVVSLVRGSRHRFGAFAAACLLPVVTVFSTPYYALFFVMLWPFVVLYAVLRSDAGWGDPGVRRALVSGLVVLLSLPFLVQFYRPGIEQAWGAVNLNPGTLEAGLAAASPTESLGDLFLPGGVLKAEKPYLGLVLVFALFCIGVLAAVRQRRKGSRGARVFREAMERGTMVMVLGFTFFAVLAVGRRFGPPGHGIALPASWLDPVVPGFKNVVKLFRILPFMAICGGLVVAEAIDRLRPRTAVFASGVICILIGVEGLWTALPSVRVRPVYVRDERLDMPDLVSRLPSFRVRDLPVLDLPPAAGRAGKILWGEYTYYQSEHGQPLVWFDGCPEKPEGFRGRIVQFCEDPGAFCADPGAWPGLVAEARRNGVGMIVLHRRFMSPDAASVLEELLDSSCVRIGADESTTAWELSPDLDSAGADTNEL